ncbi:DSD1 family PLP-dependent enzyme [Pseudoruegeria sp. HB172150]|uniref:DSD1 family PLP-dependent enzyme n=1 Tax=Pseudoruegeria sp. HB172150 TaxID=2721164 RepID=UPI00155192C7|nr:DSD1 family PLP-dependent enzyme [Pseudoruegeria sp. HB172150]
MDTPRASSDFDGLELGFDIPARPGMAAADILTPALVLDLDALERNIRKLGDFIRARGLRHLAHAKMHRSVDVARLQMTLGGASGVCCQKLAEAEVFARAGIPEIVITNQVVDPFKIDRLARLPQTGARITVCVDDAANVDVLAEAAQRHGTQLNCYVELDIGMHRCGVATPAEAVALAAAIDTAPGLTFGGLQAYQGVMQHYRTASERQAAFDTGLELVKDTLAALTRAGLPAAQVSGGGTGSYELEGNSGVFTELQCGSYAFMDADYGAVLDADGNRYDAGKWENALFLLTQSVSTHGDGRAVCDAGLKSLTTDSGLPLVHDSQGVTYTGASDEHGKLTDPENSLRTGDKLRLIPGHCDPTCNLHDWYVGVRGGVVETVWPVSARGRSY